MSKTAVITGGSKGLGFALARCLAREGYTPVLLARTSYILENAVKSLEAMGYQAASYVVDIADENAMSTVADSIRDRFGTIDFIVNNAGIVHTETLEEIDIGDIRYDLEVNLFGAILCTRQFIPMLSEDGKVLFISSGFGLMGPAGYSVYAAAKAGMINFAESVKRELKGRNIGVYVAVPSDIDTPGFRKELEGLPGWMAVSRARGKVQSPDAVARAILKRCRGGRFLIFTDAGVRMLHIMNRFLPLRLRDLILDSMFPRP